MKVCPKCGKERPKAAFSKDSRSPDGLQRVCRDCHREYRQGLRRRRKIEGRKRKTHGVEAQLTTTAICPECGSLVHHILKADTQLAAALEEIQRLTDAVQRSSSRPGTRPDPNARSQSEIEEAHFRDL